MSELCIVGPVKCPSSVRKKPKQNKMTESQKMSATIYKQLFTDSEWDAISSALHDYQDYGDEEAMIADSIQAKIATIYKLAK